MRHLALGMAARRAVALAVLLPMELVHQSVHHRREDEACRHQEHQPRIERVQAGKHLATIGSGWVHRPHAAHQHGGIQEGVAPWEVLKVLVARHTHGQRQTEKRQRGCGMEQYAPNKPLARDGWM